MSSHKPVSSLASTIPSQPEECHLRSESITFETDTASSPYNPFSNSHRQSTLSLGTTLPSTPDNEPYISEKSDSILWDKSGTDHAIRVQELGDLNTMVDEKPDFEDPDGSKVRRAKRLMKVRKFAFQCCIFGLKYVLACICKCTYPSNK
jgi:chitin synthase